MHLLVKFLKALNSEAGPWQIAFAIALGAIVGLSPFYRLHNFVVIFVVLLFRVNISSFLASFILFSGLAFFMDSSMISVGEIVLQSASLNGVWTAFYNTSLGRLSQFNHTLTMGSLVTSLALFPVLLFASRYAVVQYRGQVKNWVDKWHVVKVLKASKLYHLYERVGG
ncbi:uncharacterized protein (TIGR03546 family) [Alteromonadaceae bacterium 2753L.S.0a.02]|nr:uncharacterized protein (TIGR03546 family) [Alteromonadaceae bacterium 2753L.S.0a.02]